jgi:hypothetical protein
LIVNLVEGNKYSILLHSIIFYAILDTGSQDSELQGCRTLGLQKFIATGLHGFNTLVATRLRGHMVPDLQGLRAPGLQGSL